jgi:Leucine-rich repeat (LRR) protein
VHGIIPSEVGSCSALKKFQVSSCHLSGTLPKEIGGLLNLEQLDVSYNHAIDGTLPLEFDALDALIELNVVETGINGFVSNGLCKKINSIVKTNFKVNSCSCCKRGQ